MEKIGGGLSKKAITFLKTVDKPYLWVRDKTYGLDGLSEEEKSKRRKAIAIARGKAGPLGLYTIFRYFRSGDKKEDK